MKVVCIDKGYFQLTVGKAYEIEYQVPFTDAVGNEYYSLKNDLDVVICVFVSRFVDINVRRQEKLERILNV